MFDDLHAALQGSDAGLSSAAPDVMHAPTDREADSKTIQIPSDREHGCVAQLQPSTSTLSHEGAHVDVKLKKSRRGRRLDRKDSSKAGCDGGTHESESAVTSVFVPTSINSVCSAKDDALATSEAKSQVEVTDETADDTDCTGSVMHREYFSHVRRVNLENLSLVIGSNLPVFQVVIPECFCFFLT